MIVGLEVFPMRLPMFARRVERGMLLSSLVLIANGAAAQPPAHTPATEPPKTQGIPKPANTAWTGDFDGMVKRRVIRALVPYSKTFYFVDRAVQRGLSYEVTRLLEADINKKLKNGHIRFHVVCIPVTRCEMIPALLEGRGDIAMGNLTITPERQKQVDFTYPTGRNVVEILVTGPSAEPVVSVGDLSGKEVYLRKSSSYYQSIEALNAEFARAKKPPVKVRLAPENLEDEDVLEMVNAGLVKMTIVEDYLANFWQKIFPQLNPHRNVKVRTGGDIAWMIRKDSPKIKEELDAFLQRFGKSRQRANTLARYLNNNKCDNGAT